MHLKPDHSLGRRTDTKLPRNKDKLYPKLRDTFEGCLVPVFHHQKQ